MNTSIEGFRLSPQQRRIWSLQGGGSHTPYRVQCAVLIEGAVDLESLRSALRRVVQRHEVLRTRYRYFDGMAWPLQVIEQEAVVSIEQRDLTALGSSTQDEAVEELQREISEEPFHETVLLCRLVTLSPAKHMLLLSLPALSADKKTAEILVTELSSCYTTGSCDQLSTPTVAQYADLSEWLNELTESQNGHLGFPHLAPDAFLKFRLPIEKEWMEGKEFVPKSLFDTIPLDVLNQIKSHAKRFGVAVPSYFLTCWQILLGRLTGEPGILIGILSECRNNEQSAEAMGLFAKYLPMRVQTVQNASFFELLQEIDRCWKELRGRAEYFGWNGLDKPSANVALYPFCFEFEQAPNRNCVAETSFTLLKRQGWMDRFKVQLCVHDSGCWSPEFQYDSNLYSEDEIRRLAAEFSTLLTNATHRPEADIASLEHVSDDERRQVLDRFNDTWRDYPKDKWIHELIEQQAELYPDRIALVCGHQQMSYRELNVRASQLGHYLGRFGVGPETLVGICLERSIDMVVGILGILKAGGAWLPLDPMFPKERLSFMLDDAHVGVVVSHSNLAELLPRKGTQVLLLDTAWPAISQELTKTPHGMVVADNLAYVIYTSGSTGQPKGVAITHGNVSQYIQAMAEALNLTGEDTYLNIASMSFSSSVRQLMLPLSLGATVVVATINEIHNPVQLFESIKSKGVRVVDIVPTHWRSCFQALAQIEEQKRADLLDNRVRLIVSASEPLPADLPQSWRGDLGCSAGLINMFGQTETTGIVSLGPIPTNLGPGNSIVGIGKPIPNMQIYVLNNLSQPMPIGVPGEVFIGGVDLGRGYIFHSDLTAERFVPNPFSCEPGTRLYRTGDLARYLPDGNLEFLGRLDDQVKIRGFRIEPGEIETCLSEHHAVRRAVVLHETEKGGDTRLVAYVVLLEKDGATVDELRSHLKWRLPEYMVPARFVTLENLPLTPTGKIDRRTLAALGSEKSYLQTVASLPRNETERKLASIWAELLCIENPGTDQDFFVLGGQSLLATRLLLRVQEVFETNLSWEGFFAAPTIAGMAHSIQSLCSTQLSVTSASATPTLSREEGEL